MIYLASPYSHQDPAVREMRFRTNCEVAARLMLDGHIVFWKPNMPQKLKTPCSYPGCRKAVRGRYCEEHAHAKSWRPGEQRRGTAAERGYDNAWRNLRKWYVRQHPLCEDCLEQEIHTGEGIEVDHVIPIEVRPDLRLDVTNLRSRCKRHHRLKTEEDKKKYRANH